MPHRYQLGLFGFLLLPLFAMQGCVGIVWLGAVGTDWVRTSDVTFQPFENSWVAVPPEGPSPGFEKRITVKPFIGDQMMAGRWTTVFQNLADRRVESPKAQPSRAVSPTECILMGFVVTEEQHSALMGLKEISYHRLFLRLTTDSGALLWKTELPYTIVNGTKGLEEKRMREALLAHVRLQTNETGLGELATTTTQVVLQQQQ